MTGEAVNMSGEFANYEPRPDALNFGEYYSEVEDFHALTLVDLAVSLRRARDPIMAAVVNPQSDLCTGLLHEAIDSGILQPGDSLDIIDMPRRQGARSALADVIAICDGTDETPTFNAQRYRWHNQHERYLVSRQQYDCVLYAGQAPAEADVLGAISRDASLSLVAIGQGEDYSRTFDLMLRILVTPFAPVFAKTIGVDHCVPAHSSRNPRMRKEWRELLDACLSRGSKGCDGSLCPAQLTGRFVRGQA